MQILPHILTPVGEETTEHIRIRVIDERGLNTCWLHRGIITEKIFGIAKKGGIHENVKITF